MCLCVNISLFIYIYIHIKVLPLIRFGPKNGSCQLNLSELRPMTFELVSPMLPGCFAHAQSTGRNQRIIPNSHQGRFAASTAIEEGHMIRKLHHQCSVVQHYVPQPFYAWTLNILPRRTLFVMFWCLKNYRRSPFKIHYPQIIWKKTNLTSLQWILVDHSKGDRNPWGLWCNSEFQCKTLLGGLTGTDLDPLGLSLSRITPSQTAPCGIFGEWRTENARWVKWWVPKSMHFQGDWRCALGFPR